MKFFLQTSILFFLGISIPLLCGAAEILDPNFGKDGQLTTEFSIYDDNAFAVTAQPDGKILVAGQSENGADTDIAIARYLNDGSLDQSFNNNGQVTMAVGSGNDAGLALIVQDDGKILVAGTTDNGDDLDVALIRLQPDGIPDMDFDQDGQVIIAIPNSDDRAQSVLLQEDGKIVLAGNSEATESTQLFLARLNSDGSLDETFGDNGFAKSSDIANASALSAALQSDGRILLAGFSGTKDLKQATLFSFLESGDIDQSFGNKGLALSGSEEANSLFYDLTISEDKTILAAGATIGETYRSILLTKFTANGTADPQFNGNGVVQTDLGIDTVAYGLAIAQDGSIYLAGSGSKNQDTDFILLHFSATGESLQTAAAAPVEEEEEEEETVINLNELELRKSLEPDTTYTLTDFSSYNDVARGIYVLNDGTILLVGSADNGKDSDFAMVRYSTEELAKIRQSGGIYTQEGHYIVTTPIGNISRNSATTGGYLHRDKSSATVTARGVCYGITPAPSWNDDFSKTDSSSETTSSTPAEEGEDPTNLNPFKTNTVLEGCTSNGTGEGEFRSDLLDLTPGTTYYVRSYAILKPLTTTSSSSTTPVSEEDPVSDAITTTTITSASDLSTVIEGDVIYGTELHFTTEDACFIATAAYGSIDKSQVNILRQFRDTFLKSSPLGKQLIQSYYHFSPPLAEIIAEHSSLRQGTRILLAPVTLLSYLALHPLFTLLLSTILLLTAALLQFTHPKPHTLNRIPQTAYHKPKTALGFTLIELLVVLVIIGILAGYVGPRIMGHPEEAKRTMAAAQISSLETAIETYRLDNGTYPSTEQGLQALVEAPSVGNLPPKWRKGGYMKKGKVPKDPWANEYIYLSPGSHSDFDISSYGADHESGGEDADADIDNWNIQ